MSTPLEERYTDLQKLCDKVEPKLFDSLSWILVLNLDLIPEEDIKANLNLLFSYNLMYGKVDEAKSIADKISKSNRPNAKYYQEMLSIDPDLAKTIEISTIFFSLALRRIEVAAKLGIKQF
jgi:hypothetical protein